MTIQKDLILQWLSQAWNIVKNSLAFKRDAGEKRGLLKYLLYVLYFFILFLLFLYILFPYNKLKERLIFETEKKTPLSVKIQKLSPLFFNGIKLTDIEISLKDDPKKTLLFKGDAKVRFSLFQLIRSRLSIKGGIRAYKGEASLNITSNRIAGEIKEADVSSYTALKSLFGIDAAGLLNGMVDIASQNDMLSKDGLNLIRTSGEARFNISRFSLKNLNILGIKLPDTSFDAVQSELRIDQGRLNIKKFSLEGRDLNIQINGDMVLTGDISNSPLNIRVRIKPSIRFEEENKIFFSMTKGKEADGFYSINIRGTLRSPAVN